MLKQKKYIISVIMLGFFLISTSPAPVSAATSYKLLSIIGYAQEMPHWCWAACEKSILNYFGFSPLPSQYQIVGTVFNPPGDYGATVSQIAYSLGCYGCNATSSSSSLSFNSIQSYINQDSPMIAGKGVGHAYLIRGYYYNWPTTQDVYYIDPWESNPRYGYLPYNTFVGDWTSGTVKNIWYS